jgi:hypothetical protein
MSRPRVPRDRPIEEWTRSQLIRCRSWCRSQMDRQRFGYANAHPNHAILKRLKAIEKRLKEVPPCAP